MSDRMKYFLGVDVGSASTRAALVQEDGKIVAMATEAIQIWCPEPNYYEQSSDDIWRAVVKTVKEVINVGNIQKEDVKGIGFDATCSLVVVDTEGKPLSVSPSGRSECNIIMWMDHRAGDQAQKINKTHHSLLKHYGGAISLEMEIPKLLWIKENLNSTWKKASQFFDLCDFLTWRTTGGCQTRSMCSVVCKWMYTADGKDNNGWSDEFFRLIGLDDMAEKGFDRIGQDIKSQGEACGAGICREVAAEMGLCPGTSVAVSMVDAHCGTLGCLGCMTEKSVLELPPLTCRMALICGTSTCHMSMSEEPHFVSGVWGPLYSIIIPGLWGNEGGQSATGKLIDHVLENHVAYNEALKEAKIRNLHLHDYLYEKLIEEAATENLESVSLLTQDLHVWPDYHGNRSPLADHTMKGMVSGLTLRSDVLSLAVLYLATVQALSYSSKHIISEMRKAGQEISVFYVCGGLRKNTLYIQTHADVIGFPVILPDEPESVLLGAAILGATASGTYSSIQEAMQHMGGRGQVIFPNKMEESYHSKKYEVFLMMYQHQKQYREIMER
ncbi:hypothetical protein CHS0354_025791 [Potamilus streckersoni]|uniref:FGGY carbohydrate kinase domain-containing protein n=1 Tax=Potamilus streckersoni TaxID=2493646 RepID=A0AAE0TC10_9BIVA|nr:hypothetical protein CHS0354_025791 [Potamilus streckersoni]